MFFWKWNHFVLCMEGSMCGGTWVISHVNGCFYCQFSILHWQWHGFSLKQKKTTWLEHFSTQYSLEYIYVLLLFSNCLPHVRFISMPWVWVSKGVICDLYVSFILFRQNGPMTWREVYAALKTPAEFIKMKALRKTCWMYFSFTFFL